MHSSLVLAITFVPLVLVIVLIGLLLAWLHMRRIDRSDVVDLVAMQKEPLKPVATDEAVERRKSEEPLPQLPSMDLHDTGGLLSTSYNLETGEANKNLQRIHHYSIQPVASNSRNPSYTPGTPPKRISLVESPSREALAAFDFSGTPSKPPLPARSVKRASGSHQTSADETPNFKIEPASLNASDADEKIQPLALTKMRLSPIIPGGFSSKRASKVKDNEAMKSLPFSAVPIVHIGSPMSDDLPPTPTRASTFLHPPLMPKNEEGIQAMTKNREMTEAEIWRADRAMAKGLAATGLSKKHSGVNMHGKRNSAIREYVRNFPEQNPWRKMMTRRSKDIHAEEGLGEQEFMQKFGGGRWE